MAEISSQETTQPDPFIIELPVKYNDFANSATGEVRKKLDRQIKNDYIRLLGAKKHAPGMWQCHLELVKAAKDAAEWHHRNYRESTRQDYLRARADLESSPLFKLVRRLHENFEVHLKEAVHVAKELGKPYEEIPPEFSQPVERLLKEAETGQAVA